MPVGDFKQPPDRIDYVRTVGIHPQILCFDVVAGDVGIGDTLRRQ